VETISLPRSDLSNAEIRVLNRLTDLSSRTDDGSVEVSLAQLATALGHDRRTIERAVNRLVEGGHVERVRQQYDTGGSKPNKYLVARRY
jgi:predicted transcriptional regulator